MLSHADARDFAERLVARLHGHYRLFGPAPDGTGSCRLEEFNNWSELQPGALTRLPAKKLLLPPQRIALVLERSKISAKQKQIPPSGPDRAAGLRVAGDRLSRPGVCR